MWVVTSALDGRLNVVRLVERVEQEDIISDVWGKVGYSMAYSGWHIEISREMKKELILHTITLFFTLNVREASLSDS